ncbi:MAG: hypothetical protein GY855_05405 [candidate division Zixibacteria bacterium]|nr:hypothetical protein [candidate division Zixibacteria bacterium]
MAVRRTKSGRRKKNRFPVLFVSLILGFFVLSFLYLWEREKVRGMLIAEQRIREEEKRLTEENRKFELDIANLCSLENLRNSINDPDFGFPEPERVKHLHWYNENKDSRKLWERASDLVMDWLKEGLDVNKPTHAETP